MAEREYVVNIYKIDYESRDQIDIDDKYTDSLINDLCKCISNSQPVSDDDNLYMFKFIDAGEEFYMGFYGVAPAEDDPHTSPISYRDYSDVEKTVASMKHSLFYIDSQKKMLAYIDIGIKGFTHNLKKNLRKINANIYPLRAKDWKEQIIKIFETIEVIEIKKKNEHHILPFKSLSKDTVSYDGTLYKTKLKVKDIPVVIETENAFEYYDKFIIRGKNEKKQDKTLDIFKEILVKNFPLKLESNKFSKPNKNKDYFKNKLRDLITNVSFSDEILFK